MQNNGGALETHALLPDSNAIDAASQTWCPVQGSIDQRSIVRGVNGTGAVNSPQVGDCDIGAYEYAAAILNFANTNTISMDENTTQANDPNERKMQVVLTLPNPAQTTLGVPLDVTLTPRPYQFNCPDDSCSTALINVDFTFANQTLTIPASATNGYILEFTIFALQDQIAELGGEFAVFDLTAVGAAIAEPRTLRVSITDDDVPGVNVIESGGSTELFENDTWLTDTIDFNLNTMPNFNADVVVTIATDRDCTINSQPPGGTETVTVLNADWQTLHTVTLHVVDDLYDEDFRDETVTHECVVTFTFTTTGGDDRTGDGIGDGDPVYNNTTNYVFVTVHDNDVAGVTIVESGGTTAVQEGGATDSYTIVLDSQPDPGKPLPITPRGPTIVIADPDDQCDLGNGRGQPVNVSFTGSNWNVPQAVTVTAYDDLTVELTHNCVITHTISSDDPVYADLDNAPPFANTPASVTAIIDDFIPPTLLNDPPNAVIATGGDVSVSEVTPSIADTFTVVLFRQPLNQNVTINLTASSDPRIPGSQVLLQDDDGGTPAAPAGTLALTFTPANWNVPQTVRVFAFDDDYDETDPHFAQITAEMTSTAVGFNDPANRKFVLDGVEYVNTANIPVTITDNDTSSVDVSVGDGVTITEGGAGDSFTFTLGSHPYADISVTVDPDDQCDVGQGAGVAADIPVLADDWNQTQTVNVTAVDDFFIEGTHNCVITVVSFSLGDSLYDNLAGTPNPVTATINDNDFPRVVITTVDGIALDEANVAATDSYTVVLSSYADADVTVNLTIGGGQSLVSSSGSPAASLALTFTSADWNVPQTVTTTVIDDAVDEANPHNSVIVHSVTSTATGYGTVPEFYIDGSPATDLTVVIADDDLAGITVTDGTTVAVGEGGATDTYSFVLDSQPVADVSIEVAPDIECDLGTGAGTAITLTFIPASWNVPQDVTVTAFDDVQVEGAHSCTITHLVTGGDPLYNNAPITDVTAAITDNDEPEIAISTSGGVSVSEDTSATADTYTVVLLSEPLADVLVNITVSDGQTQISDGGAPGTSVTLTFTPANWNVAQTVSVFAVDDLIDETDPHLGAVNHAATSGAPGYDTSTVFVLDGVDNVSVVPVSIADNDTPSINIAESGGNTAVTEGGATDTYTVVLGLPPLADVFVSIDPESQCDLGAGAGVAIALTFDSVNWNTTQTVTVSAVDDPVVEGTQNCTITHTASSADAGYDMLTGNDVIAAIADNDVAEVTVTQLGGVTNVFEGGATDAYDVVLTSQPASQVTISVTFGTQCSAAPTGLFFDAANWATPQTVTVTAVNDSLIEPSPLPCVVTNAATSADANYNGASIPVNANVFDDDGADLILTQTNGSTIVDEAGATSDTYDVSLAIVPNANVTVSVTTDAECSVNMPSLTFTTGNWNVAQTITVTAVDDTVDEVSPHTCTVAHSVSSGDSRYNLNRSLAVNVLDDDIAGLVLAESGGNTTVSEADTATADTYTVMLPSDPGGAVNVAIATNGQCSVNPPSLTFDSSNWNIAQQVNVNAVDDAMLEGSPHTCVVTHTMSGAATGALALAVMVLDNDAPSLVVLPTMGVSQVWEQGATTDTVEVRLSTAPSADVYVDVTADTQCVIEATVLPLTFTTSNWNIAQSVTVRAVDDVDDEATLHPCQPSLSSVSTDPNYTGQTAQHEVTVVDNDGSDDIPTEPVIPASTFLCSNLAEQTGGSITGYGGLDVAVLNGVRGNAYCSVLALNGNHVRSSGQIGVLSILEMGVVQAVDVYGLLPGGFPVVPFENPVQICLAGSGSVLFLSAYDTTPQPALMTPLPESPAGFVCVNVLHSGKVIMVSTQMNAQQTESAPDNGAVDLEDCELTTTYAVRLRSIPDLSSDDNIIGTLPFEATLSATEYLPGWYRVIYLEIQGWVSADFVTIAGNCGG